MNFFNTTEGKRRLRLFLSIASLIIAYFVCILVWDRRLKAGHIFILFPLISLATSVCIFLITSAFYWVLEGFNKDNTTNVVTPKNNSEQLFKVSENYGVVFHESLIAISQMAENKDLSLIEQIFESWKKTAFIYTFGLTSLCLLMKEKDFFNHPSAKEFLSNAANKYTSLSIEEDKIFFPELCNPEKSKQLALNEVHKIIKIIIEISLNFEKNQQTEDPLGNLNEYVAEVVGLTDQEQMNKIRSIGKSILSEINKSLL
tara:strand:- start:6444 stop:7217 length:774 start_codon:yes stop_codon:yes gene_type:complete